VDPSPIRRFSRRVCSIGSVSVVPAECAQRKIRVVVCNARLALVKISTIPCGPGDYYGQKSSSYYIHPPGTAPFIDGLLGGDFSPSVSGALDRTGEQMRRRRSGAE